MAELSTIARPYAEAAFRLASETNAIGSWADALFRLAAVSTRPEARAVMTNPRLTAAQIAAVIGDTSGQLTTEQKNFVQVLADNERLAVLPDVATQFNALRSVKDGAVDADLIGGVSIRIGDEVTDLSVKGKLAQLQKALAV